MPIIVLQHSAEDTPGRIAPIFRDAAHKLDIRRLDVWAAQGGKGPGGVPADLDDVDGVICLGGAPNVGDAVPWMQPELEFIRAAHARQLPVIGFCLGHQMIAAALGGEVGPAQKPEAGFGRVTIYVPGQTDAILAGLPWSHVQFHSHAQEVRKAPEGAAVLMSSTDCKVQCFRAGLRTYGFQFHPECTRTDLDARTRDAFTLGLLRQNGQTAADLAAQIEAHYEEYERVSRRLLDNLSVFLFPMLSRLR